MAPDETTTGKREQTRPFSSSRTAATESARGRGKVVYVQTDEVAEVQEECWRKNPRLRPGANLVALRKTGLVSNTEGEANTRRICNQQLQICYDAIVL